jgi:hypothetical protein
MSRLQLLDAVEMAREGVPLKVIQRQLGHVNLGVTSVYLDGIDTAEIIGTVHNRRPPMISQRGIDDLTRDERSWSLPMRAGGSATIASVACIMLSLGLARASMWLVGRPTG